MSSSPRTPVASTRVATSTSLWPAALVAGLGAAVATTAVAAVAHAAGVSLDVSGSPIPLVGFTSVTLMATLIGLVLAAGIRRWAGDPRRTWLVTTVILTALSFVPDATAQAAVGTRLTLVLTHLTAAAIVIPGVASRLGRR
jgi:hypothetical protein